MREIVVLSGKGGTGKTSLTAAFAMLAGDSVLCDADVDAADLHLLLRPEIRQRHDFIGGAKADIVPERCTSCGLCRELCRFDAISADLQIDSMSCEGCGVCADLCPVQAIDFTPQQCGEWYISATRFGPMVHARLGIAEENSGKLVSLIRKEARQLAEAQGRDTIVTDGPPGIGCPVIAALGGATQVVLVVEPTVSGLHDMGRVIELAAHFRVPAMVCVNKFDINPEMTAAIEQHASARGLTLLGRIPFAEEFTQAMIAGQTVLEYAPTSQVSGIIRDIWHTVFHSAARQAPRLPVFSTSE